MKDQPVASGIYPASDEFIAKAHINAEQYDKMYKASVQSPEAFWAEQGQRIDWITPFSKVKNTNFD
uniref:acetyl-coenzyme A synthetase N-terminal domain-containing protein n=1 Tax=Xinfangfangia pollutisoli TaxID=2865960 RepID=UPI001CD482CA